MVDFKRTLTTVMPEVSQQEQAVLGLKYEKPGDPNQIDFLSFSSDLQQIVGLKESRI